MDLFKRMAFLFLFGITAFGAIKAVDLQFIDNGENQLANPGFENGKARWTATGGSFAIDTSTPLFGTRSATWDPSATAQELSNTASAVPAGMAGNKCQASFYFQAATFTTGEIKVQVEDGAGTALSSSLDLTQQANPVEANIFFDCPSSGNWHLVFESTADADSVEIDKVHLGLNKAEYQVSQTELYGTFEYNEATNCFWQTTSATYADFAADADCNDTTATGNLSAPATVIPGFTIATMIPGVYIIKAKFDAISSTTASDEECSYGLSDDGGTTVFQSFRLRENEGADNSQGGINLSTRVAVTSTETGNQYTIVARRISGTGQCAIEGRANGQDGVYFEVIRYPTATQTATVVQGNELFLVDVNIGGANPALGTSSLTTYTEITDAGLDLVDNNSTASGVEIPCSGTNPSTGLTCSAGSESIGVVFNINSTGLFEAKCEFGHLGTTDSGEGIVEYFQLVETPNNAQTILQEGNSRIESRPGQVTHTGAVASGSNGMSIGGVFNFTSTGQKTIRLMHESVITGTVNTNQISANRSAIAGQRDIHCTVKKLHGPNDLVETSNSVKSGNIDGLKVIPVAITWQGTGVPILDTQFMGSGDPANAVSSIDDNGTGDATINWATDTWSSAPFCQCTTNDVGNITCQTRPSISNTSYRVLVFNSSGVATDPSAANEGINLVCVGPK